MARLIKAIINFFRGLFGIVAEKLEDDVRDGKIAIEDSKEQISDFRIKIARLIAENKKMSRSLEAAKQNVTKWQSIADTAGSKQDWVGAEKALGLKNHATKEVTTLNSEIVKTNNIITNLKKQLETAKSRIGNAESNITRLEARNEAAEIRAGLAKASAGLDFGGALASIDKLGDRVDAKEAEAEALEEMSVDNSGDSDLESRYGSGSSDVSDELAAMKAKFNKPE